MKRQTITILVLILFSCFVNGQDTITGYFDHKWKKCDRKFAIYYRKAYPDSSGMWIVKDYHMNGLLQMTGMFSDKKLKKNHGSFTYYHHNGKVSSTGQYSNNKQVGLWKNYYTNGNIASEGKVSNNKIDSIWTYYHIDGAVLCKKNCVNGKQEGESKWYYESGEICEIATYKRGNIKSKVNYDESGNIVKKVKKDCHAEFPGGNGNLVLFLQTNLKYPEELLLREKEGIVLFSFIVRKDGSIDNIEYIKSDEPLFNQEAFRTFNLIKHMTPACLHGQFIDEECILPITFRLKR